MIKILNPERVPPGGGFIYVQPESGQSFKHAHFPYLLNLVKKHRLANNYPIGVNWDGEVMRQICEKNPELCGDVDIQPGVQLGMGDIVRGTRVIAEFKLAGSPLVPQEEADRRAAICSNCAYNMDYTKSCSACTDVVDLVRALTGGRKTKFDADLKACNVCHCANAAQVHLPLEILRKGVNADMDKHWPVHCWKKPE